MIEDPRHLIERAKRGDFVAADIKPDFRKTTKGNPGEVKRRWVNQKFVEADIRAGWNHVYSKTGEIVSRPASDNKRAFLLEFKAEEYPQTENLNTDHKIIDGVFEELEDENEYGDRRLLGTE